MFFTRQTCCLGLALWMLLAGKSMASLLSLSSGDLLLVGQSTEVTLLAGIEVFNATSKTYTLSEVGNTTSWPCTCKSTTLVSCNVTLDYTGDFVFQLMEAPGDLELSEIDLQAYIHPTVESLSPAEIPITGGAKFFINFPSGFWGNSFPKFDGITARFALVGSTDYEETTMEFVDSDFLQVYGRSPSLTDLSTGDVVSVDLAMNGRTFVSTGFTVNMVTKEKVKIGFVYVGAPDDFGWNFQQNLARLELEDRFYGQIETIYASDTEEWGDNECEICAEIDGWDATNNKWSTEPSNYYGTHRSAIIMKKWIEEEDVKMIIASSYYFQWDTYYMAAAYPNVAFVHTTGYLTRSNMAQVFPKIYQTRYLTGIAMAWYIKANNLPKKVGYVSAFAIGECIRAINAVKLGMEQVDPEIDIYLTWLYTWLDPRLEDIAVRRLARYYDVQGIAQHTDSTAPQLAAAEEGIMGTGYNSDMLYTVGDSVLTSPVLIWADEYATLVQQVIDGDPQIETNSWKGYDHGTQRLSDFSPNVPAEARMQIEEEQAKFEAGTDEVFCKANLMDNKGRIRNGATNPAVNPVAWEIDHLVEGTTCLTDAVISMSCQEYDSAGECIEFWLLNGVHDSCDASLRMPNGIQATGLPNGTCFLGGIDIPDQCPEGQYLDILGCTAASLGHYAKDEVEYSCAVGYYSDEEGLDACVPCPAGYYAGEEGSSACTACPTGTYGNTAAMSECRNCSSGLHNSEVSATACSYCPIGTYAPSEGMEVCTDCPSMMTTKVVASDSVAACVCDTGYFGTGASGSGCSACPDDSSTDSVDSRVDSACLCDEGTYMTSSGTTCVTCPNTMTCPRGSSIANFALYLGASGDDVSKQYPQLQERYWSSASDPMSVFECSSSEYCPGGDPGACSTGLTGQACEHCYSGYWWNEDHCEQCWDVETTSLLFPIIPLVLMPIIIILLYSMFKDKYANWGSWRNGLASLLFVVLNNYQVVAMMGDMNIAYNKTTQNIFSWWSWTTDLISIFRPNCAGFDNFNRTLLAQTVAPAILMGMFFLTWSISQIGAKLFNKPDIAMEKNRLLNVFFSLILTFFAGISAMAFTLFKCASNPNGIKTLTADRSVNCYEDDWNGMVGLGVAAILIWVLGFAVLFGWAILWSPKLFPRIEFQTRWKFLFIKYRADVHWWSMVFVVKGILLNLGFLLFDSAVGQIYWIMAALVVYLCACITFTPWRHMWVNVLDIWSHTCLLLMLSSLVWFAARGVSSSEEADADSGMSRFTVATSFLALPCILPVVAYLVWWAHSEGAVELRRKVANDFVKLSKHISLTSGEVDFEKFINTLADRDFAYIQQAERVLTQELLHIQSRPGYSSSFTRQTTLEAILSEDIDSNDKRLRSLNSEGRGVPHVVMV